MVLIERISQPHEPPVHSDGEPKQGVLQPAKFKIIAPRLLGRSGVMDVAQNGDLMAARHSTLIKFLLPLLLFVAGFAEKWGQGADAQQRLIHLMKREFERPREINKQHDAIAVGVVPNLVVESIVEDQAFAPGPVPELVADADAALLARLRHEQPQVKSQHPVVSAAMGGN